MNGPQSFVIQRPTILCDPTAQIFSRLSISEIQQQVASILPTREIENTPYHINGRYLSLWSMVAIKSRVCVSGICCELLPTLPILELCSPHINDPQPSVIQRMWSISRTWNSRVLTTLTLGFFDLRINEMLIFFHASFPVLMARINSILPLANILKFDFSNSRIFFHLSS